MDERALNSPGDAKLPADWPFARKGCFGIERSGHFAGLRLALERRIPFSAQEKAQVVDF
jgi:hypothetical protein